MASTRNTTGDMDVVNRADREAPEVLDGTHLAQLAAGEEMSVQHFTIESGSLVGLHSHEHEQAGYLFEGQLTFTVDGEEYHCTAGDSYVIPAHAEHSAENRGDTDAVGIEIFSPPRPNPPWEQ